MRLSIMSLLLKKPQNEPKCYERIGHPSFCLRTVLDRKPVRLRSGGPPHVEGGLARPLLGELEEGSGFSPGVPDGHGVLREEPILTTQTVSQGGSSFSPLGFNPQKKEWQGLDLDDHP